MKKAVMHSFTYLGVRASETKVLPDEKVQMCIN